MLTDPQSITISGTAISLPRTSVGAGEAEYTSADGLVQLVLSHNYGKRNRHVLRLNHSKITTDPFIPADNVEVSASMYTVFDVPPAGYSVADLIAVYAGWKALYTASSDAVITRLLGGES
jgi:hypothetical protein